MQGDPGVQRVMWYREVYRDQRVQRLKGCRGLRGAEGEVLQGYRNQGVQRVKFYWEHRDQAVQSAKGCRRSRGAEGQQVQRVQAVKGA